MQGKVLWGVGKGEDVGKGEVKVKKGSGEVWESVFECEEGEKRCGDVGKCWLLGRCGKVCWDVEEAWGDVEKCWEGCEKVCWGVRKMWGEVLKEVC